MAPKNIPSVPRERPFDELSGAERLALFRSRPLVLKFIAPVAHPADAKTGCSPAPGDSGGLGVVLVVPPAAQGCSENAVVRWRDGILESRTAYAGMESVNMPATAGACTSEKFRKSAGTHLDGVGIGRERRN